ncbi:MAG: pyruvate, phosphate dikinase [Clostridia bacterium]|nr:pyruvate, phosphate dikinase [Clostridia bacterium]
MKKYVYLFKEGNANMRDILGGKGANLAEMTNLGLPVPYGFTVSTEACTQYYEDGRKINDEILGQIYEALDVIEKQAGKKFGDPENPFLVSVRSGARASMPGMMDTILNLGLNDQTVVGLAKLTNNERFAYDSYRRFIMMFSDVVMEISKLKFDKVFDDIKKKNNCKLDTELNAENLKLITEKFKEIYRKEKGTDFPQDPRVQLIEAVKAVFRSWDNPRADVYRRLTDIPYRWGTAVNVQSRVFGNMGNDCGTGVAFTRNPSTGEKALYGEFLMNAQGEDVVAGIRTPSQISDLQQSQPTVYKQFVRIANTLEQHYRDMQDMEFTIERGKLFMLQTRNGKRTASAALKIAVDLVNEGLITKEEALLKIEPKSLDALLHPTFEPNALKKAKPIAKGLPASPGAACGRVYFNAADCIDASKRGEKVVLVRLETSPEDIEGMYAAEGVLTARGGMTSHAAVVARGMGTCCVSGCSEVMILEKSRKFTTTSGLSFNEGDWISLDGSTGNVYGEALPTIEAQVSGNFATIMQWADEVRQLKVRTNADNPHDAATAVSFGAEGIGLCRTEHMFFDENRIPAVREMIVSSDENSRRRALSKLLPMQRSDFKGIYKAMGSRPVTIRFLDPPLHEFLPSEDHDIKALAKEMGLTFEELKLTVTNLHEMNPMLGHRGCRLSITYPEIAEMQTRAVIEAAIETREETGISVIPEIMVPLVGDVKELEYVKDVIDRTAKEVMSERNVEIPYVVGTMIEVPRAARTADKIAEQAKFFTFGTNVLSQMTFGLSRDDAGKFLDDYYKKRIYEFDPFARVDQEGVGRLMKRAAELGRKTRPDIKLGICGEHGGDPSSIEFCHQIGLNYVSCSPFRVPIARLAAAQAAIRNPRK